MGKRAFVTGAGGFIGSHLTEHLLAKGYKVKALVLYNKSGSWECLENSPYRNHPDLEIVHGDIQDTFLMGDLIKGTDIIFHLAALISIPYSYKASASYVSVNISGTLNILEAARKSAVEKMLYVSSSEVYGTAKYVPIDEEHPLQAQSPYSASKISAEAMCTAYHRSFDTPVVVVRPFNTYGPRQSERAIIPTIIRQLLEGAEFIKLGDLRPTRDFNYVKDTVSALELIASNSKSSGEVLNIATGTEISMEELATRLIHIINPDAKVIQDPDRLRPARSEVFRLMGNASKLKEITRWRPLFQLEEGLQETITWYKEELEKTSGKYKGYHY